MIEYAKLLIILPLIVVCFQLYRYTITLQREEKQRACRSVGIIIFTSGVLCLVFRNFYSVIAGLAMIMAALRLIAYGLERQDKTIFIDSYHDDVTKK